MLHDFVTANRDEIIGRCRAKVAHRASPTTTKTESDHGVPMFLDQLVDELRSGQSENGDITKTAARHGHDLLRQGFTASQVVHDYGDVCQSITEMAVERNADISADDFRLLNRCLDDAIAGAVTQYGVERDRTIAGTTSAKSDRLTQLTRDLLNALDLTKIALSVIQTGTVGVAGSTGNVLRHGIEEAHYLASQVLAEVAPHGAQPLQTAALDAKA